MTANALEFQETQKTFDVRYVVRSADSHLCDARVREYRLNVLIACKFIHGLFQRLVLQLNISMNPRRYSIEIALRYKSAHSGLRGVVGDVHLLQGRERQRIHATRRDLDRAFNNRHTCAELGPEDIEFRSDIQNRNRAGLDHERATGIARYLEDRLARLESDYARPR